MLRKNKHRLTEEAIKALKQDNELCLAVANELNVTVFTLPSMISRNSKQLTSGPVADLIAKKIGKSINEVVVRQLPTAA